MFSLQQSSLESPYKVQPFNLTYCYALKQYQCWPETLSQFEVFAHCGFEFDTPVLMRQWMLTGGPVNWVLTGRSYGLDANKVSCGFSLHSQRPATASVCGREERGGGEARSALPRCRRSGLPTLCHRRHSQTAGPGAPEQESSAPVNLTSCP